MSAQLTLKNLYQQWLQWTEQEGDAIRAAAWPRVSECQDSKLRLQDLIRQAKAKLPNEILPLDARWKDLESELNQILDQLIGLEKRNSAWLVEQRHQAEIQGRELGRSQLHLRQLHRAYVQPATAAWHSYS
jgi:hypothetical protein